MPGLPPIRWIGSQVTRLRKAVSSYNAAITRLEKEYGKNAPLIPPRTSMADEMKRIKNRRDLDRRVKDLGGILKKNDPRAQEIDDNGQLVYTNKQNKKYKAIQKSKQTKQFNKQLKEAYGDEYEKMSSSEKALARANSSFPFDDYDYFTPDEMKKQWDDFNNDKVDRYIENYIKALKKVNASGEFVNKIANQLEEMKRKDPERLRDIFTGPINDLALEIFYIYEESPDLSDYGSRKKIITRFWDSELGRFKTTKVN